jgi:hypothetical protein
MASAVASRAPFNLPELDELLNGGLAAERATLVKSSLTLQVDPPAAVAASVLWLPQISVNGRLLRVLSLPKMRFSAHDATMRELTIGAPAGISIRAPYETEPAVFERVAQNWGDTSAGVPQSTILKSQPNA